MAHRSDIPLVLLLSGTIIGVPIASSCNDASHFIAALASQQWTFLPFAPKIYLNLVDVRDVAASCAAVLANPTVVRQRFIVSNGELGLSEIGRIVRRNFSSLRPPVYNLPNFISLLYIRLFGLFGDRMSFQYLKQHLGRSLELDNRKARLDLGIQFHDVEQTIADTVGFLLKIEPTNRSNGRSPSVESNDSCMSSLKSDAYPYRSRSPLGLSSGSTVRTVCAKTLAKAPRNQCHPLSWKKQLLFLGIVGTVSAAVGYMVGKHIR
jgi:hypothetical protein